MASFSKVLARWGTRPAEDITSATDRLLDEARAATKLRSYRHDPDVAALTIEHTRERVERVLLVAMTCGLLYTTVNVQAFIAGRADGIAWWAAWLVEPFVTAGVLALLRIEQVARRNSVIPGAWVRATRWTAFAVTYVFNTWLSWIGGDPQEIFKHSAIPVLVFFFAEALTDGRDALTTAAEKVASAVVNRQEPSFPVVEPSFPVVEEQITQPLTLTPPMPPEPVAPKVAVALTKPRPSTPEKSAQARVRMPKGYLKEVAIPAAYRELAMEAFAAGHSLDTIALSDVDTRAGTNKYVTKAMIAPLREQLELEVRDGVSA